MRAMRSAMGGGYFRLEAKIASRDAFTATGYILSGSASLSPNARTARTRPHATDQGPIRTPNAPVLRVRTTSARTRPSAH